MNKQKFNIAITGFNVNHSEELKNLLRKLIPQNYMINWVTASDQDIDCLFIHENFYETEGIQRILQQKKIPWLKVTRNLLTQNNIENHTLFLPILQEQLLFEWIEQYLIHTAYQAPQFEEATITTHILDKKFFLHLSDNENNSRIHLQDNLGTLAVIQPEKNIAWINLQRTTISTNYSFHYDLANTTALTKVSRKYNVILHDWLWNLFWNSPDLIYNLAPEDGHYKIHTWPKPADQRNRKMIFQLSACFIQGGKISKIAEQLKLPQNTVRHFIATNIASNNIEKINIWDKHYSPPPQDIKKEEQNVIHNFFGKLRRKFGF